MSMQRDDYSGLPTLESSTIFTHVNKAGRMRSEAVLRALGLLQAPSQASAEVLPLQAQPSPGSSARLDAATTLTRTGPDCIRYAV